MIGAWIGASIGSPGYLDQSHSAATLAGTSALTGIATPYSPSSATLAGTSALSGVATPYSPSSATLAGTSALTGLSGFTVKRATDTVATIRAGRATATIGI